MKEHKFEFNLPMHPYNRFDDRHQRVVMKMDGRDLNAKAITIRAGDNGFTNVAVEFNAPAAVKLVGALLPSIDIEDGELCLKLATCYRDSVESLDDFDKDTVTGYEYQAFLVKTLLEKLLDEFSE